MQTRAIRRHRPWPDIDGTSPFDGTTEATPRGGLCSRPPAAPDGSVRRPPGDEVLDVSFMLSPELGGSGRFFRVDDNGIFATSLETGESTRLSRDPAYTDPVTVSPDGTAVVYYQRRGCNEGVACPPSTEPGGRQSRLMIADLTDRAPTEPLPMPEPVDDLIPWGITYEPGDTLPPIRKTVPSGTFSLPGQEGSAEVVITNGPSRFNPGETEVVSVEVTYAGYSANGVNFVDGTEAGIRGSEPTTITWHADLTFSGAHEGTPTTSEPEGFVITPSGLGGPVTTTGSMTTVLDGMTYTSPAA